MGYDFNDEDDDERRHAQQVYVILNRQFSHLPLERTQKLLGMTLQDHMQYLADGCINE